MTSPWRRRTTSAGIIVLLLAGCYPRVPAREANDRFWFPFLSGQGKQTDLWAVSVPGGQYRQLTDDVFDEASPTLLADGRIVYASHETGRWRLMIVDPQLGADVGRIPRPLYDGGTGDDYSPVASPTGQVLFVSNRNGRKQIFAISPGARQPVLLTPQQGEHDHPAPAPDGGIYYISSSPWRQTAGTRQIWQMEGDGRNARPVSNLPQAMSDLALLPADKLPPPYRIDQALAMPSPAPGQPYAEVRKPLLLFTALKPSRRSGLQAGGTDLDIYRLDTSTQRQLNLTDRSGTDEAPVVMPSGLIAFTTDRRGKKEIWTMDGWGGEQRPWINGESWVKTR